MPTKKELAILLSKHPTFAKADPKKEQYPTDSNVAADLLWAASLRHDLEERRIADLGCGTGILTLGALEMGASHVTAIDLDTEALVVLQDLITDERLKVLQGDISTLSGPFDTVLMNPPFGTRDKGADVRFLEKALTLAPVVYSMHKTSTMPFLRRKIEALGGRITWEQPTAFPLKASMAHHTRKILRIEVTLIRVERVS